VIELRKLWYRTISTCENQRYFTEHIQNSWHQRYSQLYLSNKG